MEIWQKNNRWLTGASFLLLCLAATLVAVFLVVGLENKTVTSKKSAVVSARPTVKSASQTSLSKSDSSAVESRTYDVVVLGGSSAGVAAAISAARQGVNVALVEETQRLGGMISNGVSGTDISNQQASNGLFEEFRQKVAAYYEARGQLSQVKNGLIYEPDVARDILESMVTTIPEIEVLKGFFLRQVDGVVKVDSQVTKIFVENGQGATLELTAKIFIDATDAGDLLGQAGVEGVDWVVGRESGQRYGEYHAGEIYVDPATQDRVGGSGAADSKIQAYNFRMIIQKGGFAGYAVPPDYQNNLSVYRNLDSGGFACREYPAGIWIQTCLPNDKMDINLDLVGVNHDYPKASRDVRAQIYQRLKNFAIGYLHFLRTEKGYSELGLSKDDFEKNSHFPTTLYIREARRMIGTYIFREQSAVVRKDSGATRAPVKKDSIAIGDYPADSHCVSGAATSTKKCEGGFYLSGRGNWPTKPYQIPYGVIVPKTLNGLLVPVALSASHVGYGTLRMEPVRTALGQAAGTAAAMAVKRNSQPRNIPIRDLQINLASRGQALMYFSDLPKTHWAFSFIQALAGRGAIVGYGDYTVRPNNSITRAEAATLLVRAIGMPINTSGGPHFKDVPTTHWAYPFIETLYNNKSIVGYGDGTYRPGRNMTRAESSVVVARAGKFSINTAGGPHFKDATPTHWAYPFIETLYNNGIVKGTGGGYFQPDREATRAEAVTIFELTSRK